MPTRPRPPTTTWLSSAAISGVAIMLRPTTATVPDATRADSSAPVVARLNFVLERIEAA